MVLVAESRQLRAPRLDAAARHKYSVHMIRFEWDPATADENERKHGVGFAEASTAFADPFAGVTFDPDHSNEEDRFVLLGMSTASRMLVVCHCYREDDEVIRIISAWKAVTEERKQYGQFL